MGILERKIFIFPALSATAPFFDKDQIAVAKGIGSLVKPSITLPTNIFLNCASAPLAMNSKVNRKIEAIFIRYAQDNYILNAGAMRLIVIF